MPKVIERVRHFALDDETARVTGRLPGFRRWISLVCEPMAMARVTDTVEVRLHQHGIFGEGEIMDHKEIGGRLTDRHFSLLVVRLSDEAKLPEEER